MNQLSVRWRTLKKFSIQIRNSLNLHFSFANELCESFKCKRWFRKKQINFGNFWRTRNLEFHFTYALQLTEVQCILLLPLPTSTQKLFIHSFHLMNFLLWLDCLVITETWNLWKEGALKYALIMTQQVCCMAHCTANVKQSHKKVPSAQRERRKRRKLNC